MDGFTTLKQVAELAGVSTSTASRVISKRGYVSADSRDRVLEAARRLGYEPDLAARTLKFRSSSILGVEIQDITNPFYASLASGIADVARAAGFVPLVIDSQEDPKREAESLRVMLQTRVAGLIIVPTVANAGVLRRFQRHSIPLVQLDRLVAGVATDAVLIDDFNGAVAGTRHLIDLGHTRIGVIAGPPGLTTGRQRLAGFEHAMQDRDLPVEARYVKVSDYRSATGEQLARELLDERPRPTAIFTHNNVLAENLLTALAERRVSVPHDIAVVTFDDPVWTRLVTPPLTVIQQPSRMMGSIAADLLLKRIRSPATDPSPTRVELSTTLIVRGSCGGTPSEAPASGDPPA